MQGSSHDLNPLHQPNQSGAAAWAARPAPGDTPARQAPDQSMRADRSSASPPCCLQGATTTTHAPPWMDTCIQPSGQPPQGHHPAGSPVVAGAADAHANAVGDVAGRCLAQSCAAGLLGRHLQQVRGSAAPGSGPAAQGPCQPPARQMTAARTARFSTAACASCSLKQSSCLTTTTSRNNSHPRRML